MLDAPTAIIDNLLNDHVSELAAQLPAAWQSVMNPDFLMALPQYCGKSFENSTWTAMQNAQSTSVRDTHLIVMHDRAEKLKTIIIKYCVGIRV